MDRITRVFISAVVAAGILVFAVGMSALTHWLQQFEAGRVLMVILVFVIVFAAATHIYHILPQITGHDDSDA